MPLDLFATVIMEAVATFCVVVGSHRSIAFRKKWRSENKEGEEIPSISRRTALCLPIYASLSLMIMYFLFTKIQVFLVIYMVCVSVGAVSYAMSPIWNKIVPRKETLISTAFAGFTVLAWLYSGHWFFIDVIGASLSITLISIIKLDNLKISMYCLVGLFFYDIFWVFLSSYIFGKNVMVEVATKSTSNPIYALGQAFNLPLLKNAATDLQLPMKLIIPNWNASHFSMLGL